ncbi:putative ABC transport system permease protein [Candidatus Xenohaliotis californiensis]|uniref:ABC transport system permease protein n=1 Tax=Candidatus Xenohaliotis californiensis TaxID=84677 RepID=A0ABP0ERT1_9RICK|nr:putative ABC transport system permease protein [Candidatus Xenohaliotis californiensis]
MTLDEMTMSLEIGLVYGIVAIGIYITFRIIDFPDLTCDGSFVLGAAVSSILAKNNYNPWFAIVAALSTGCVAGIATGLLYTHLKISNLLSGILVSFMLYSVNLHIMNGVPNISLNISQTIFSQALAVTILSAIVVVVCLLIGYLFITDFGLALYSIGQNKKLAQYNGINIKKMTIIALALSNGFIALGGALFSQNQGFADIGSGIGTIIVGLASIVIGEKILQYRNIAVKIISCVIGSVIYRALIGFALHSNVLGLQTFDLNLITGVLIIVVMCIPRRKYVIS